MYCLRRPGAISTRNSVPIWTPEQMLELSVFCGKYLTDCRDEFPARAKLSPSGRDCLCNYFGVDGQPTLVGMAEKGLDTSERSARLVPVVLSILPRCGASRGCPRLDRVD